MSSLASLNEAALAACRTALRRTDGLYPSVPNSSRRSSGKKNDPALRTPPGLPPIRHLPGPARDRSRRGAVFGRRLSNRCPLTLRTRQRLVVSRASGGIIGQVLLQQPVGQFAAQTHRQRLPLIKRDQLILPLSIEQNVECSLRLL